MSGTATHPIGHTRNNVPVYVDLIRSRAATNIAEQPYLLGLVKEALAQTTAHGSEVSIEHNMGRSIGYSFVVQTTDQDSIVYGRLLRDTIYTRFVKNGQPLPTQYVTMLLRRNDDQQYELYDTWIGPATPPRPGSTDETSESKSYWANHAFVLGKQTFQVRTLTKVCPY